MTDPLGPIRLALAGRYEIEREIGQGAFARVYLARDLRHDRLVAFKVLTADPTSEDSELRFLSEIRLLAKLQHPNIVPLIDSGHAGATLYYVMPYVKGESLRERIRRERQMPLDAAIAIAREAADALAYAHDQGIIHRDIKPENILLSAGHPMIADFGVARAIDLAGVRQLTRKGMAAPGTPAYMSPEQLLGTAPIDQRSDIYSLGCVLYEMLTGRPPFAGEGGFANRFTAPPPSPSTWRRNLPAALDAIVARALAIDPKDRYPTAGDFARALAEVSNLSFSPSPVAAGKKGKGEWLRQRGILYALIALAIFLSGTALWGWMRPAPPQQVLRYTLVVDSTQAMVQGSSSSGRLAISPDGSTLAYIGGPGRQLLIRPRNQLRAIAVSGTEGATTPFFSPDGQQIGFVSGRNLETVSRNGGAPTLVTDSLVDVAGASWGGDGFIYADGLGLGSLVRVEAKPGAVPKSFTVLDTAKGEIDHRWPDVLPNGKGVVFTVMFTGKSAATSNSPFTIAVADIPSGKHRVIVPDATYARYAMSGDLLYVTTNRTLMVVPFDQNSMKITGVPTVLIEDMRLGLLGSPDLAISDEGTLVYATSAGQGEQELVWVTRDGKARSVDPDWQGGSFSDPSLSPDGSRLAVVRGSGGETGDIWIKQLDEGPGNKLTQEGSRNASPSWVPDGRSVTFSSNVAGPFDLWTERADGSAQAVSQFRAKQNIFGSHWSRDGKWLVFQTSEWSHGSGEILGIRPGLDTVPVPLVTSRFREVSPAPSPDGRWLAYTSDESGQYEIYVVPFPNTAAAKWVVSTHGGTEPRWSHAGSEVFYRDASGNLVAVEVKTRPTFSVGRSATLFPAAGFAAFQFGPQYDVSADDQRFLMIRPLAASGPDQLVVVENWFEELKAKSRK
ncbi:MAG: eukaryotic-like serine/threonine-protein kinase [Acidimicrobiaceae bacterium]